MVSALVPCQSWTVNLIALILAGGPSIALPVGRDALDGTTPTRKLPWGAAELWPQRLGDAQHQEEEEEEGAAVRFGHHLSSVHPPPAQRHKPAGSEARGDARREEEAEGPPPGDPVRTELFPAPSAAAPGREPAALAAAAAAGAGAARGSGGATLRAARREE